MSDLISFDYAIKYLLKDKGDYEIVEGFISALLASEGYKPIKIKVKPANTKYSIYCVPNYGPRFGGEHDICIVDNANANASSFSNLGYNYMHLDYAANTNEAKSFLAGAYNFQISEIEVFSKI